MPVIATAASLKVQVDHTPVLNFAMEHCGVPFIHSIRLEPGETTLKGATLCLELVPDLGDCMRLPLPDLVPGEALHVESVDYRLPPGRLRQIVETEYAELRWWVEHGHAALAEGKSPVEVHPFNHWPGYAAPPSILASFAMPNHPALVPLLLQTRDRLAELTGSNAILGYQSGSTEAVKAQVRALYDAIAARKLSYVGVPASFEQSGQKIRLPDQVFEEGMACCLDMAALFAGAMEQMNLNPLIALIEGHAFVGVWLVPDRFPEGYVTDAARIRNQMALDQILVFEATAPIQTEPAPFEKALELGRHHMFDDAGFEMVLDVSVLRRNRIRPLPLRASVIADEAPEETRPGANSEDQPFESTESVGASMRPTDPVQLRFRRWQEKLLDLSMRNRLLNCSLFGKGGVNFLVGDLAKLEDHLAAGKGFEIEALPLPEKEGRDARLLFQRYRAGEFESLLDKDMHAGVLRALYPGEALVKLLKGIERTAREDLAEGGAHTLYLAIGMLQWYESTSPGTQARYAPLLLYPVTLEPDRARQLYRVTRTGDDPVPNVTLAEKLKEYDVDLSGLLNMQVDDSGVDVTHLLAEARKAIQRKTGWEILADAHLGLFTFTKFLMWRDLNDNADILLTNEVVRHVASPSTAAFHQPTEAVAPESLDHGFASAALPCVVDADSTQLSAVASAVNGRSFVLQGPPGTGKSQTITNMIAALLAAGKRILFVSEKMTALEVVYRRLKDVGLGDFCLELHSHKSNKKEVLGSLGATYQRLREGSAHDWEERNHALEERRKELNDFAVALHAVHPIGFSLYKGLCRLMELANAPELKLEFADVAGTPSDGLRHALERIDAFAALAERIEPIGDHPFSDTRPGPWTAQGEAELESLLSRLIAESRKLETCLLALGQALGIEVSRAPEDMKRWGTLTETATSGPMWPEAMGSDEWPLLARIQRYVEDMHALERQHQSLAPRWQPEFWQAPRTAELSRFETHALSFPLVAYFQLWGARAALKALSNGKLGDNARILADLRAADALRAESQRLEGERTSLRMPSMDVWTDDLVELEARIERASRMRQLAARLSARRESLPSLERMTRAQRTATETIDCLQGLEGLEARLRALLGTKAPDREDPGCLTALTERARTYQDAFTSYRPWALYLEEAAKLEAAGLGAVVTAHGAGLPARELVAGYERALLRQWTIAIRDRSLVLRTFEGSQHAHRIERFQELDQALQQLARRYVVASLEARLPNAQAVVAESSEPGILMRELKKKTRQLAVRKLFQAIPNMVFRLKPCFMMSPLSIAQYLPADWERFDVVIFDEASQIGTHDAIGAIARGRQVIVVGDSKQLPPTAMFQRKTDDGDFTFDENDVVEMESVLDETVAKQLPQQMLGWHYRSRHESLIDFSNRHYYENDLSIFPAAQRRVPHLGIKWHHVPDGVFMSGSDAGSLKGTNPREAEVLVDTLVDLLRQTAPGSRTFGVVTFSKAQKDYVDNLLEAKRGQYPEIEPHFTGSEGVFVKNLENVQGDERDEILFSVGYARDHLGRLRMMFGPLSTAGGERRLNVAITRARCQMRVFSTLTADQIDPNRTTATGTKHLRAFLQFASQHGDQAKDSAQARPSGSSFEQQVRDVLAKAGYETHSQIGCGGYRIDLAVVHPADPGAYVLGIETDGPHYKSARTARDRDRLRAQVLKTMGWRLHRLWLLDWISDRAKAETALLEAIKQAIESPPPDPPVVVMPAAPEPAAAEPTKHQGFVPPAPPAVRPPSEPYRAALLAPVPGDVDAFCSPSSTSVLSDQLLKVIEAEAPVSLGQATRRVVGAWAIGRQTERVRDRVLKVTRQLAVSGHLQVHDETLWPASGPRKLESFRVNPEGQELRDFGEIPIEELAIAVEWVLAQSLSIGRRELLKEVAKLFGISRLGRNVESVIEAGLEATKAMGSVTEADGTLTWRRTLP